MAGREWQPAVYDVHPSDPAIREAIERGRAAEADPAYWSSTEFARDLLIGDGWPWSAAEQMALQHARAQALNEAQAGREAGQ